MLPTLDLLEELSNNPSATNLEQDFPLWGLVTYMHCIPGGHQEKVILLKNGLKKYYCILGHFKTFEDFFNLKIKAKLRFFWVGKESQDKATTHSTNAPCPARCNISNAMPSGCWPLSAWYFSSASSWQASSYHPSYEHLEPLAGLLSAPNVNGRLDSCLGPYTNLGSTPQTALWAWEDSQNMMQAV